MKTRLFLTSFVLGLFFVGCTSSAPSTTGDASEVFTVVNDAMLLGDVDTALMYSCEGSQPTEEQIEMIRMALSMVPEEMRTSIEYTIDTATEMEGYTEIRATMRLMGEEQLQVAKIYHEGSAAHANYCINLTETDEDVITNDVSVDVAPVTDTPVQEVEVIQEVSEEVVEVEEVISEESPEESSEESVQEDVSEEVTE